MLDVFTFGTELDILEARLRELGDVVDTFVIVEAATTFSGHPKPLTFQRHKHRFQDFAHKIVHYEVDLSAPAGLGPWERQSKQRGGMSHALDKAGALPDDLVIVSDLDEIPRKEVIDTLRRCRAPSYPVTLQMTAFMYDFGCAETHGPDSGQIVRSWRRAKVMQRRHLAPECGLLSSMLPSLGATCVDKHRSWYGHPMVNQALLAGEVVTVVNAGWHLSYFMDIPRIVEKVASYAHTERNTERNRDRDFLTCMITKCRHINGHDVGTRAATCEAVGTLPAWVRQRIHLNDPRYRGWCRDRDDIVATEYQLGLC